jgi:hypothetical protein
MVGPEPLAVGGRKVRDGEALEEAGVVEPVEGGVAAREPEVICCYRRRIGMGRNVKSAQREGMGSGTRNRCRWM